MTDPNLTHIVVILDRSGSMQMIDKDTTGGFNAFVDEQKKAPGRCTMTLIRFDTEYKADYVDKPIADVPTLKSVEPRGNTALYDAIGKGINELGEKLRNTPEDQRPGRVVFVILTDGQENSSKEFTREQIKDMVEHQTKKYNWAFTYLGANQDAVLTGTSMGFSAGTSMTYTTNNAALVLRAAASNVASYRASVVGSSLDSYSDHVRTAAVNPGDSQVLAKP